MKNTISLSNFSFKFAGSGHYKVTYKSLVTGRMWTTTITDMPLVDATKNADETPKKKDLEILRRLCKK